MKTITFLLVMFFCLTIIPDLLSQEDEIKKKSSIEIIGQVFSGRVPLEPDSRFFFTGPTQTSFYYSDRLNPEVQIRYVKELIQSISVYGSLSYGVNYFWSSLIIREGLNNTSSLVGSNLFRQQHKVSYASGHAGLRYDVPIGKDDSFNFSLGGKGIFYPKQNRTISRAEFSDARGENISYTVTPTIASSSKFVVAPELEINYLLAFKKFPLDMIFGITFDQASEIVSVYNTAITFPDDTVNFIHDFGGGRTGVFVGLGYDFGQ